MSKSDAGNAERSGFVLAIDPGDTQSAWVLYDGTQPVTWGHYQNSQLRTSLYDWQGNDWTLACESIECYGQRVGNEVFNTMRWIGRFQEIWHPRTFVLVPRRHVKLHLCGTVKSITDGNIASVLYDRYGGSRQAAVGTKKNPGPLFGIGGHERSALAVAITFCEYEEYQVKAGA